MISHSLPWGNLEKGNQNSKRISWVKKGVMVQGLDDMYQKKILSYQTPIQCHQTMPLNVTRLNPLTEWLRTQELPVFVRVYSPTTFFDLTFLKLSNSSASILKEMKARTKCRLHFLSRIANIFLITIVWYDHKRGLSLIFKVTLWRKSSCLYKKLTSNKLNVMHYCTLWLDNLSRRVVGSGCDKNGMHW